MDPGLLERAIANVVANVCFLKNNSAHEWWFRAKAKLRLRKTPRLREGN